MSRRPSRLRGQNGESGQVDERGAVTRKTEFTFHQRSLPKGFDAWWCHADNCGFQRKRDTGDELSPFRLGYLVFH